MLYYFCIYKLFDLLFWVTYAVLHIYSIIYIYICMTYWLPKLWGLLFSVCISQVPAWYPLVQALEEVRGL